MTVQHRCDRPRPRRRLRGSIWVCGCGKAWALLPEVRAGEPVWWWQVWDPHAAQVAADPGPRTPRGYESFKAMLVDVQDMVWPDTPRAKDQPETSESYVAARRRLQRMLVAEGGRG